MLFYSHLRGAGYENCPGLRASSDKKAYLFPLKEGLDVRAVPVCRFQGQERSSIPLNKA